MDIKTQLIDQPAVELEIEQEKTPSVDEVKDEVVIDSNEDMIDVEDDDKDGDTFKEEGASEGEGQANNGDSVTQSDLANVDNEPTSPSITDSYRIPKLSEKQDDAEQEQASDSELLVDETIDVEQAETEKQNGKEKIENEPEALKTENESEAPKTEGANEEDKDKDKNYDTRYRKRNSKGSRSKSQDRSRSRSRDRRRRDRSQVQELIVTNSGSPDMVRSRLFIGHVNTDNVDKEDVRKLFSPYGKVIGITLNKGYGFVQYDNEQSAKAAIREVHGTPFGGAKIVVDKTVALKRMLGEDPRSEPPLPRDSREGVHRRRERSHYDEDDEYMHRRYSRLEMLERYLYDRYDRYGSSGSMSRSRDSYYDSYYDRPPPSYNDSYDRPRYSDMDRDRYIPRERERYPPPPPRPSSSYYDRHRDDRYDDYDHRPLPMANDYDHYPSRRY